MSISNVKPCPCQVIYRITRAQRITTQIDHTRQAVSAHYQYNIIVCLHTACVLDGTLDSSAAAYISEAVTVDSAHHYPNGDNVEVIHSPGEHVTNDITMATKRASPSSCSSVAKRQKQRKKEQDKMAALKYRHRKKQEVMALDEQQTKLEHENTELIRKIELAEEQIIMLKSLLRKIYAPCNHSNSISDSTPQSSPNSNSE